MFDIPIVLLMFKRDKITEIIDRIRKVKPQKIYLISDGGRDDAEWKLVNRCRKLAEKSIDWHCEVIKNYANHNRGVYENIGEGAKWVFKREKWAIFLEDDNLPEVTFFQFCKEILERYERDWRVLWVCGTNYLGKYQPSDGVSYCFTKHLLPCGWASWSDKFLKMYDGNLESCNDPRIMANIPYEYFNRALYRQYRTEWMKEYQKRKDGKRYASWDMQMDLTIKANSVYGVCPTVNQIKNIGVDEASIHGGNSMNAIMTRRFCGMDSFPIKFPLVHPKTVLIDEEFEAKIGRIILRPLPLRIKAGINPFVRRLFRIPDGIKTKAYFKQLFK